MRATKVNDVPKSGTGCLLDRGMRSASEKSKYRYFSVSLYCNLQSRAPARSKDRQLTKKNVSILSSRSTGKVSTFKIDT